MSTIIIDKKTGIVKFSYNDIEEVIMGSDTIKIPNNPPARVVHHANGKTTTYLGGTVICDKEFITNAEIIKDVQNIPVDIKTKKYEYDKSKKQFTIIGR